MYGLKNLHRLIRRFSNSAIILLYHRVANLTNDPQWLCVPPNLFAEHMEILQNYYHPISLFDLCKNLRKGKITPKSVVVTFDDGYADNYYEAKPTLMKFAVPATVFAVSGMINKSKEFWWDELARILLNNDNLPEELEVSLNNQNFRWQFNASDYNKSISKNRWHVLKQDNPTPYHKVYRELAPLLRDLDVYSREKVLIDLRQWANIKSNGRSENRVLNEKELIQLSEEGLVEIGAHTVTHSVLSASSEQKQIDEISESKRILEEILGKPVNSFSYPYGGKDDYSIKTEKLVRKAGFSCACSNYPGQVYAKNKLYRLPRHLVRDWDGDLFKKRMEEWFAN